MNVLELPPHTKATTADLTEDERILLAGIALKDAGTRAALVMFARKAIEEDAARRKTSTVISITERRRQIADQVTARPVDSPSRHD
ncbi:hypothetical protein MASR1M42_22290 [Azonexus hydrophilus]